MKSGIVPNSDSTFHTWARIEALPEEREQHRGPVEHPGMLEPRIFSWGEAGNVECGNWEFGNVEQWDGGSPPLLTLLCFPEPESSRNLTLVVAVSVIAAIVVILLIGFSIWRLQSSSPQTHPGGSPCSSPPAKTPGNAPMNQESAPKSSWVTA
ncbi:hypothetical protein DUI87_33967 [Hirundo rustica rustica]|uniref:Uncharacterized protein n=1 Tax=Hirundo rustica rustica TaxID=333673 RepID=A0A3M0ILI2_HIRRU|nr:hypothetical protein DUI87_33967 [Hirundo rustica rustica]